MAVSSEALSPAFDIKRESEFIQVCETRNVKKALELLAQDHNLVNKPASDGRLPLMFAAQTGFIELVEKLLERGAELDAVAETGPNRGLTALWFAMSNKQWQLAILLLEKGAKNLDASPQERPNRGVTALLIAMVNKQWPLATLLLEKGAKNLDVSSQEAGPNRGLTALLIATNWKQWPLATLLLEKGAKNLDASSQEAGPNQGLTALWFAMSDKQWPLATLLLEKGAKNLDTSPQDGPNRGVTALLFAAANKQWGLAQLLLEKGASIDASPEAGPVRGLTALWFAIEDGHDEGFRALLARGASLELTGNAAVNIKNFSELLGHPTRAESHCDLRITFENVRRLFALARNDSKLNAEALQLPLKKVLSNLAEGSALNGRINGETALHVAIKAKNQPFIEALVLAGADLLLADNEGQTAQSLLPGSPLVQSFAKLQHLKSELDKLQTLNQLKEVNHKESKEATEHKESKEVQKSIQTISEFANALLKDGQALAPGLHRDTLYYQLGELFHHRREGGLFCIPGEIMLKAFSRVSRETKELYSKACAKWIFYERVLEEPTLKKELFGAIDEDQTASQIEKAIRALDAESVSGEGLYLLRTLRQAVLGVNDDANQDEEFFKARLACRNQHAVSDRGLALRKFFKSIRSRLYARRSESSAEPMYSMDASAKI